MNYYFKTSSSMKSVLPVPHIPGKIKYKNGDDYTGIFVGGNRYGKDNFAFGNGETWNRDWLNDSIDMNGNVELTMGE